MKVDDVRGLLAAIDPANRFRAGVGEMLDVDLQIDLVAVSFGRLSSLRRCQAAKDAQEAERKSCCLCLSHWILIDLTTSPRAILSTTSMPAITRPKTV